MSENKCCGNCKHFQNESATGNGWCNENDWISKLIRSVNAMKTLITAGLKSLPTIWMKSIVFQKIK